ncbi:MAG: PLP-dependent transferase [Phycisphaerales bacterium]|jgi:methionine-gamma-lyase|nr:PLP-dependent transferase [Phycisphaerales bacterium]
MGAAVSYPGLQHHPDHPQLAAMANPGYGCGGLLTLDMGSADRATALLECLQNREQFGWIAVSLGFADSLLSCPAASTSSEMDEDSLSRAGIPAGLVRISAGYTGSLEQRWEQLDRAVSSTR